MRRVVVTGLGTINSTGHSRRIIQCSSKWCMCIDTNTLFDISDFQFNCWCKKLLIQKQ